MLALIVEEQHEDGNWWDNLQKFVKDALKFAIFYPVMKAINRAVDLRSPTASYLGHPIINIKTGFVSLDDIWLDIISSPVLTFIEPMALSAP